ncbi:hypothetical protein F4859DRAFT_74248 [Xylaria cf. heliscus]|nr:hypothetical protein F4859DRAFT_74248 [Xylaria cf. heliscus]
MGYCIIQVDGFWLCRRPSCKWCAASPEFVPFHRDCFEIFRSQCSLEWNDALRRLWVAAAWRTPWRGASPMLFPIDATSSLSLKVLCDICKLPQLYKIPIELLHMIQSYSKNALLWRSALAFEFAASISHGTPSSFSTIPLKDIVFWERGKQPQVTLPLPPLPLIKIVIDSAGVKRIERTSVQPYKGECYSNCAYMVEEEEAISGHKVQFKDGFVRLELTASSKFPAVWNTPHPPNLQLCRGYETRSTSQYQRFSAVELASIRGITFFFSRHQLYGIHIHRSGAPDALSSFQRITPRRRRITIWCYLPIAKQDRILVLGLRMRPGNYLRNILVRMEKAGDVIIGPYESNPTEDQFLGWHAPITLVHREPQEGHTIPYLGAYCQPPTESGIPKRFRVYKPEFRPIAEEVYLSIASLEGLQSVEVFYDQSSRHCRGMVLYYQNGGCRAVGQCRFDVDSAKHFIQPSQICFRSHSVNASRNCIFSVVEVDWKHHPHTHEEKGWNCQLLKGNLLYWYNQNSSFIAIENETSSSCS